MSDLGVITALRPDVPLPTPGELDEARCRLVEAIMLESNLTGSEASPRSDKESPRRHERIGRRARLGLAAAVVAAAAGLAVVLLAPGGALPGGSPGAESATARLTAQFLHNAATAALHRTVSAPPPDQFVYSENEAPDGTITQTWLSVDGGSAGLTHWSHGSSSGGNSLSSCTVARAEATGCYPEAGYLADMPTDPNLLLAYFNKIGLIDTIGQADDNQPGWEDNVIAKTVSYLLQTSYLLPAQQAALYSLIAQTPGFQIIPNMTDAVGRSGVGVGWTFEGSAGVIIFDPTTYSYLGTRTWPGPMNIDVPYDGNALVDIAIVSNAGAQP